MDSVRTSHGELVSGDGQDVVVITLLERLAEVLAGLLVNGSRALGDAANTSAIEVSDSLSNLVVRAVAGLWVVVAKNAGLLDVVAGPVIAPGRLGERLKRSVAVLSLTRVPLGHGTVDVSVSNICVRGNVLVHGDQTVNIGVVKPENGVKSRHIKVVHVAARVTTSSVVDNVVDRLEAVDTAAAQISTDTNRLSGSKAPRLLAREERKDTVTERNAEAGETTFHLVVVAASRVGNRATESAREVVPWTTAHLIREGITPAVRVQRVGNGLSTLGLGDSDALVTNRSRNGRTIAWVHGPIPVGHAKGGSGIQPSLTLVLWEFVDNLHHGEIPCLLNKYK